MLLLKGVQSLLLCFLGLLEQLGDWISLLLGKAGGLCQGHWGLFRLGNTEKESCQYLTISKGKMSKEWGQTLFSSAQQQDKGQ